MPTKKVTTSSATTKKTAANTVPAKKPAVTAPVPPPPAVPPVAKSTAAVAGAAAAKEAPAAGIAGDKPVAKPVSKAPAAKKPPVQQKAASRAVTRIIAKVDIGYGNDLYLRGEGAELSWTQGVLMVNTAGDEWLWTTENASGPLTFKFLINDEIWSAGDNQIVAVGDASNSTPVF